ncbi:MAG: GNAT family N-acetyltransferase [Pseudomonadota bacterium]
MDPPSTLSLRLARAADAPVLAEMSRRLIETGLAWRYTPRRMASLIGNADTIALVAHDATHLLGFAVMQFGDEQAHLVLLCVQTPHQRRGIGRSLTEWLLGSARVAGIASIGLELRADNAAALAFYRGLGFAETELVPAYYDGQIPAQRMTLRLRAGSVD